jgi:hypothetical protein
MKAYRVAEARAQFGTLLDEAEGGDAVLIERDGIRFRLAVESVSKPAARGPSVIEYVDPDVLNGSWTWTNSPTGLRFRPRHSQP